MITSYLLHTGCEDRESACPLGRIGTFGGSCIPESFVCDGFQDCVGGTDEMNCTGPSKTFIAYRDDRKDVDNILICLPSLQHW